MVNMIATTYDLITLCDVKLSM